MILLVTVSGLITADPSVGQSDESDNQVLSIDEATLSRIGEYVEQQRSAQALPGLSLAVVHGSEVVLLAGFGEERLGGAPMTERSRIVIASLSKSITAMAVMVAAEQGLLDLDEVATTYLPEWAESDGEVTIRQLMHHRSGISTRDGNAPFVGSAGRSLEANIARLGDSLVANAQYEYSNANYDALALIVERASSVPFPQFVEDHIFGPLGMSRSDVGTPDDMSDLAPGHYHRPFLGYAEHVPWLPEGMVGSYMMTSTAEDMSRLMLAHLGGGEGATILSEEGWAALHEPYQYGPASFPVGYAGGLHVFAADSFPCEGARAACGYLHLVHDGSSPSYRSFMAMTPQLGLGIVTLANANDTANESTLPQINQNISYLLYGERPAEIVTLGDPLLRWGKELLAAVVMVQLLLGVMAFRALRKPSLGRRDRAWLLAATVIDVVALVAIVVIIPGVGESPLMVTFSLPDFRLLIVAMATGIAWGGVRTFVVVRRRLLQRVTPTRTAARSAG